METQTLKSYLEGHPFLHGLSEETLELLSGFARNVRYDAGAYVFRQGGDANEFFLVRYGSIAVETAPLGGVDPVVIQSVNDGDVLGWSWMFPPYKWRFDARATMLTRTLVLDGAVLRQKCEDDPALGFDLMKRFASVMSRRLEATRMQLKDVYSDVKD